MTRYPLAESVALSMRLPITRCSVTDELYGYAYPVLDRAAAARALCAREIYIGTPAHEAAMAILEMRVDNLRETSR